MADAQAVPLRSLIAQAFSSRRLGRPATPLSGRRLAVLGAGACLLLSGGASTARAATTGVLPPRNPAADCTAGEGMGLSAINACRAQEGVGPLILPSNWNVL